MNKEILDKLHQIGLSVNEAKVYTALLGKSSYSATECANIAGVPRQMIYRILDSLINKGLCILKQGKIKKYSAADPKSGIKHLVEEQERKAKMSQELLLTLHSYFKAGQKEKNPLEYITIIKEKKQIAKLFMKLEKESLREILVFAKPPYSFQHKDNITEIEVLKKGITIKTIYENNKMIIEKDFLLDMYISAGEEARVVEELPIKLAIFDEKTVLLALKDPITHRPSLTTMLIEHSDFAKVMKITFESIWNSAMLWNEYKNTY